MNSDIRKMMSEIINDPRKFEKDPIWEKAVSFIIEKEIVDLSKSFSLVPKKDYKIWGKDQIEIGAIDQMNNAMSLPIAIAGALMPDAHQGYGLPIGGVFATKNEIIPYAVGVDIGCRMMLTVYDVKPSILKSQIDKLTNILYDNTRFGTGSNFDVPNQHNILDRKEFSEYDILKDLQNTAVKQLGSSGGGNHFVEFGHFKVSEFDEKLNIPVGEYIAILTHSGSRGLGATVANIYKEIAMAKCKLPIEAQHLAWLDMNDSDGIEYWNLMNFAGDYAQACHHTIHNNLKRALGWDRLALVENHHNFAWKEIINGEELIVHRKGATPAGNNVLGIIPGSMGTPGFVVKGKGSIESLNSASHGAGRVLSRNKARDTISKSQMKSFLKMKDISLLGGDVDESPFVYKDINQVMAAQSDLVDVLAEFNPKIVRMADKEMSHKERKIMKKKAAAAKLKKEIEIFEGE